MPIRMVDDNNQESLPDNSGGGGNRGGGGGGIGGMIGMLLPLLFRYPKLLIPALLIGGAFYFFSGKGCSSMLPSSSSEQSSAFSTGANMDQEVYDKAEVFEGLADNKKNPLPEAVSLEQFCPRRLNQGAQGSCVAWSSGYAARTILEAERTGQDPNAVAFSPSFLYNQIKLNDDCQGSYIHLAMEKMKNEGMVPFKEFPYDDQTCSNEPGTQEKQLAQQFKMKGFNRLTKGGEEYQADLLAIKQNLAQGAPVVIGMLVGGSFMQDMMGKDVWVPTQDDYDKNGFGGHAMCLVGYDDNKYGGCFRIMNSWGEDWGNKGFAWIRYKDFKAFAVESYGVYPMGNASVQPASSFDVSIGLVNNETQQNIPVRYQDGLLFANTTPIKKGSKFKVEVTNSVECYIYVFGQETDGSSYVLFPYTPKHSPYCGITGTRVFPKDKSMMADNVGSKDYMAVLVTRAPVDYTDINARINSAKNGNYEEKVNAALSDMLSNKGSLKDDGENVKISAPVDDKKALIFVMEINKQ